MGYYRADLYDARYDYSDSTISSDGDISNVAMAAEKYIIPTYIDHPDYTLFHSSTLIDA
jgi:hypothetical protein